jgi:predicted 3-demethylubiquinone-9 3-methyltransferase (glyoxalase superfamily)
MQKITPHLWFDKEAHEAATLYTSLFESSSIKNSTTIHNTPSGDADILTIVLAGQEFMLINGGPYFKFNPSVSFTVACPTKEEVEKLWQTLAQGGSALMELGAYPFSEKYGWVQDKFGLSWQLMYVAQREIRQKITPMLMFVGEQCGKAEEAIKLYTSVFHHSGVGDIMRYQKGAEPDQEGTIQHASFMLAGEDFAAMDSAWQHQFGFNEAVSFVVKCETQAEIDYFWERLSADPSAEQCGWLKDKYTVSWQIVPTVMDRMLADKDEARLARVTEAFLKMKKFEIEKLQQAYEGNS